VLHDGQEIDDGFRLSSMRDSDRRSSISRAMRPACSRMTPRKRSRAGASLRAEPCSVSMNPTTEASGVRSSWLALATKSTRMCSRRRASVRSARCSMAARVSPPSPGSGTMVTAKTRSTGTRSTSSTDWATWPVRAWSSPPSTSGARKA
jgi:hypothetical protein